MVGPPDSLGALANPVWKISMKTHRHKKGYLLWRSDGRFQIYVHSAQAGAATLRDHLNKLEAAAKEPTHD